MKAKIPQLLFVYGGLLVIVAVAYYAAGTMVNSRWTAAITAGVGVLWLNFARPRAAKRWPKPKNGWVE